MGTTYAGKKSECVPSQMSPPINIRSFLHMRVLVWNLVKCNSYDIKYCIEVETTSFSTVCPLGSANICAECTNKQKKTTTENLLLLSYCISATMNITVLSALLAWQQLHNTMQGHAICRQQIKASKRILSILSIKENNVYSLNRR